MKKKDPAKVAINLRIKQELLDEITDFQKTISALSKEGESINRTDATITLLEWGLDTANSRGFTTASLASIKTRQRFIDDVE